MARFKDREKAILLRKEGMSYSQIKKNLKLSKSTLSLWLRDYPLSKQRIRELRDLNEKRIERFRMTFKKKKEVKLKEIYKSQKKLILPFSDKELFLSGLLLYWGEGVKSRMNEVSVSNNDPSVIRFFLYWLNRILKIPKDKIKVYLHLYNNMDITKEKEYWSKALKIPLSQFTKPYIKNTSNIRINHKGAFGHGTCNIRIFNTLLAEKILMSLKVISDWCNKKMMRV